MTFGVCQIIGWDIAQHDTSISSVLKMERWQPNASLYFCNLFVVNFMERTPKYFSTLLPEECPVSMWQDGIVSRDSNAITFSCSPLNEWMTELIILWALPISNLNKSINSWKILLFCPGVYPWFQCSNEYICSCWAVFFMLNWCQFLCWQRSLVVRTLD